MSAKRRTEALVNGRLSEAATASASGRLLLQATIFMLLRRKGGSSHRSHGAGILAFYQSPLGLSMNLLSRHVAGLAPDDVIDATRSLAGDHHGDVRPVVVQRAGRY